MPSWFTSKLACTGGFGSKEKDTAHATGDASLQNGRVGGGLDVPVLEHESQTEREAEEADEVEDGVSLAEAESGVSLTYKGVTQDGGLLLDFQHAVALHRAKKPVDSRSLRKLRQTESHNKRLSDETAAKQLSDLALQGREAPKHRPPHLTSRPEVPKLAIVLMATGTRGDVQPFMALGMKLKSYGHRVRIASHKPYRDNVLDVGLEFYPLGGDPKVLSEYIVKNRGIIPTSAKDAYENYKQVEEVIFSTYDACTKADTEGPYKGKPFRAQLIVSNPPCYGHIHVAEKLQVPLHLLFTMPWSPTKAFPHPLARLNVVKDTTMAGLRNQLSYSVVNEMVFSGLAHMINKFRRDVLQLPALRLADHGATQLDTLQIPFSYCWSPSVVPKPSDWGPHIDITGYLFLNESKLKAEGYTPPKDLAAFLAAGPPPVYIGFGSLVIDNPREVSEKILAAARHVEPAGQRILLSRGWGKLGDGLDIPANVLQLDAVPHDWLLPQCSAVVHHGGAGTTAAGLLAECPTLVVPFFGDQSFWGAACYRMGVGPPPLPIDKLTTEGLIEALEFMRKPEAQEAARKAAANIAKEDGVGDCMAAIHHHLPVEDMIAGRPVEHNLTEAHMSDVFTESASGVVGLFTSPVTGARKGGVTGGLTGLGKGIFGTAFRPIKGLYLSAEAVGHTVGLSSPRQVYAIQRVYTNKGKQDEEEAAPGSGKPKQSLMASLHQKFSGHSTTDGASTKQSQNLEGIDPETSDSDLNPTTGEGADFKYKLVPVAAPGEEQK